MCGTRKRHRTGKLTRNPDVGFKHLIPGYSSEPVQAFQPKHSMPTSQRRAAGRIAVAKDKVRTTKKNKSENLTNVAQGIADRVRPLINARRFTANFPPHPTGSPAVTTL